MLNKLRKLFNKQKQGILVSDETVFNPYAVFNPYDNLNEEPYSTDAMTASSNIEHNCGATVKNNAELHIDVIPSSNHPLAVALSRLLNEHGLDFILSDNIVNALSDYNAFINAKASKSIFRHLVSEGFYNTLINLPNDANLYNEVLQISDKVYLQMGFTKELTIEILWAILEGIGRCDSHNIESPSYFNNTEAELEDVSANATSLPTQPPYALPDRNIFGVDSINIPPEKALERIKARLSWILAGYCIEPTDISIVRGPRVSLYELEIPPKMTIKLVKNETEIMTAISPSGCRLVNPLPDKLGVGIEIPNPNNQPAISLAYLFGCDEFKNSIAELPIALGVNSIGQPIIHDLATLQNIFICGSMQQGKTSLIRQIIVSLLMSISPDNIKFVIADGNNLNLLDFRILPQCFFASHYDEINEILTEPASVSRTLSAIRDEINFRKELFQQLWVHDIDAYNHKSEQNNTATLGEREYIHLPHIICIIDDFSQIIDDSATIDILADTLKSAQETGIHFILSTRDISIINPITAIWQHLTCRICFKMSMEKESKQVIMTPTATNLLIQGDAIIYNQGILERCHTARCESEDISVLLHHLYTTTTGTHRYYLHHKDYQDFLCDHTASAPDRDPLFEEAARFLVSAGTTASTSSLQRRYNIGYCRSNRLMTQLETAGIVGPAVGAKPRRILVDHLTLESILG